MESVPDVRRARLSSLTAGALVAAVALGATAAAGLPQRDEAAAPVAVGLAPLGTGEGLAPGAARTFRDLVDAATLFGAEPDAPAPAPAPADKPVPVAQATRSALRPAVPPVIPPKTAKNAACLLDLGYGTWQIDTTAARALTMFTAVAYRKGINVTKAARAFQKNMHTEGRTSPDPELALDRIRWKYKPKNKKPRQLYVDAALAMYRPHALTCVHPLRQMPWQPMLTNGLTWRSEAMLFGWWDAYGGRPIGGFSPEGITTGHIEDSAHYDGRAVDISFSLADPVNKARGWLLAHWLVAHADYFQIQTIIWDGLIWSNYKSAEGWRKYQHPWGPTKSPTLNHFDHIHVDVVKGWSADMPVEEDEKPASAGHAGSNAPKADPRVGGAD